MSSFEDIQIAKKKLNALIKKRELLVSQYFKKYIEQPSSEPNQSTTFQEFRDFFEIKNLQQLPNFRSFQNSTDSDLLNWGLRKISKKPSNESLNSGHKDKIKTSVSEKNDAKTDAKTDKLAPESRPRDAVREPDGSDYSERRGPDKSASIGEKRTHDAMQTSGSADSQRREAKNDNDDDDTKQLHKRLKINELSATKRFNKFASQPTNVKLKDGYLEFLQKINSSNNYNNYSSNNSSTNNSNSNSNNNYNEHSAGANKSVNSFYHQDRQNTKETVYLTMNPVVPTSIPNSKPLYEVVYLQNTLPLKKLICSSEKVLTTDIWERTLHENKQAIVSNRIEDLKRSGKWSLRQEKIFKDPVNEVFNKPIFTSTYKETARQMLLKEAHWVAVDFKEYSRWKMAMKVMLSQAVMDYFTLGKEFCCVKVKGENSKQIALDAIAKEDKDDDIDMLKPDVGDPLVQRAIDEELVELINYKPAFKFDLIQNESTLNKVEKAIIDSLPTNNVLQRSLSAAEVKAKKNYLDELLEEELSYVPASRIMYPKETDHYVKIAQRDFLDLEMSADAITKKRGLFGGNSMRKALLKPPTPPNLECIKHRMPVFWLPKDDELLVSLINEYRYNWDIIASHMNNRTTFGFQSSVMKRTAWTCFERYLQLNEKFDLSELKGYRASLALAWLNHQNQIMDAENEGKTSMKPIGLTEDSKQRGHRSLLWASIFDGMRKVIIQRENKKIQASQNRQKANNLAAQAKANAEAQRKAQQATNAANNVDASAQQEQAQPKRLLTPLELSEIKYKRDAENRKQQELKKLQAKQKLLERERHQQQQKQQSQNQFEQKVVKQKITPRELIETYANKLMNARPNVSREDALKAAETYYRTLLAQQQKRLGVVPQKKEQPADQAQPSQPAPQ